MVRLKLHPGKQKEVLNRVTYLVKDVKTVSIIFFSSLQLLTGLFETFNLYFGKFGFILRLTLTTF